MIATAEGARDASKLERGAKERGAQRLAVRVEEIPADAMARVANRLQLRARERERRRENLPDAHRAAGGRGPLRHHSERVALLEIAAHVDLVFEDVGERPRELLARVSGQELRGARVHRVIK